MIAHDFSLPVKQVRIDTSYFRLVLILVITQLKLCCGFLNLRLHIVPVATRIVCKLIVFLKVSRNP